MEHNIFEFQSEMMPFQIRGKTDILFITALIRWITKFEMRIKHVFSSKHISVGKWEEIMYNKLSQHKKMNQNDDDDDDENGDE